MATLDAVTGLQDPVKVRNLNNVSTGLRKPAIFGNRNTWAQILNANWDIVDGVFKGTSNLKIKPKLIEGEWKIDDTSIIATGSEINYLSGITGKIQTQIDSITFNSLIGDAGISNLTGGDILVWGGNNWEKRSQASSSEIENGTENEVRSFSPAQMKSAVENHTSTLSSFVCMETRSKGVDIPFDYKTRESWFKRSLNEINPTSSLGVSIRNGNIILENGTYLVFGHTSFFTDDFISFRAQARLKEVGNNYHYGQSMRAVHTDTAFTILMPVQAHINVPQAQTTQLQLESIFIPNKVMDRTRWGKASNIDDSKEVYSSLSIIKFS